MLKHKRLYAIIFTKLENKKENMFNKKTVKDASLKDKVVLLRADYNVPISYDDNGSAHILNDFRIKASLPTIEYLINQGVKKIIIVSHLGRPQSVESLADIDELEKLPNGKRKYSLMPVFKHLKNLLQERDYYFPMNFHATPIFSRTHYPVPIAKADDDYKIEMLENIRFCKDEKRNSLGLAQALKQITGAGIFVQDGFGVVHRGHSSTEAIAKIMPSYAGLLIEKEVGTLYSMLTTPKRPFIAVLGGGKISDKLPLIEKFIALSDKILITGAIANTFLQYKGYNIGKSKIEDGQTEIIESIYEKAIRKVGIQNIDNFIILPSDIAVKVEGTNSKRIDKDLADINNNDSILDIGHKTIRMVKNELKNAETVIWNGTAGVTELEGFKAGSAAIAESMHEIAKNGGTSIIGGGDTSSFVLNWCEDKKVDANDFSLISTGGGATLELISGEILPGLEILPSKRRNINNRSK
ncbi:phosphoglycerate kinase [Candidatus Nanogingivalis gingivitcus]|jgi:phosphoglycerate kinase|uniref:Phosphoglycerate kinase n=1 Tax=Candidatus Nanogingivalis gingivitcus TaxID=2171992 RepID=A0ABY0FJ14_9BACT|nr:phosphoglycerate kinase [Candidatus Nanogingivalis gingivitcus]RYC72919.1 Bifunctional PGK/TIM [Candidatus Nanogingivalis gingivitcus]